MNTKPSFFILGLIIAANALFSQASSFKFSGNVLIKDDIETLDVVEGDLTVQGNTILQNLDVNKTISISTTLNQPNDGKIVMGYLNRFYSANDIGGIVSGKNNKLIGYGYGSQQMLVIGDGNTLAFGHIVFGSGNHSLDSSVDNSNFIWGDNNALCSHRSVYFGSSNVASGYMCYTFGDSNRNATQSYIFGNYCEALDYGGYLESQFLMGNYLKSKTKHGLVFGLYNNENVVGYSGLEPINFGAYTDPWDFDKPLLILGNGYNENNRSNALVVFRSGDMDINGNAKVSGNLKVEKVVTAKRAGDIYMGAYGRIEDRAGN